MLKISVSLFNQVTDYCRSQLPDEACGAFFGTQEQNYYFIKSYKPIKNVATSKNTQFEFAPEQLLTLLYESEEFPWIGIFHSHPLTAAYPSELDLQNPWRLPIYAILSFEQSNSPVMKSYEIMFDQQKKVHSVKEQTIDLV